MLIFYKNSVLASIASVLGSLLVIISVAVCSVSGVEPEVVLPILIGIALIITGKLISTNKQFQVWWKQVTDAKLDEAMKTDAALAVRIYNKNPKKRTLKMIAQLNPAAAQYIEEQRAKK